MNVKNLLKEYGITPSKKLGQSFLISEKIANRIVEACEVSSDDVIIEVGAGLGILTECLCGTGAVVFAVEKDLFLFEFLTQRFKNMKNLILLNQDILSVELSSLKLPNSQTLKLVSNLPYSITSDFLYWLLENRSHIASCVLTLQKEVARRIYALPGTKRYGSISVLLQSYMQIKPLFLISGDSFFPKSKVESQVIVFEPKSQLPAINERLFFEIVHTAFAERRKQLKNSLKLKANAIGEIDLTKRPETLKYEEFINLTLALQCMELN